MKTATVIIAGYALIVGVFFGYAWRMIQIQPCIPSPSVICDQAVSRSMYHGIMHTYYWRCDQYLVRDGETINISQWEE